MIETLQELVQASGVERMNLSIQKTSEARVAVAIQCILGSEPKDPSDDQRQLREVLSQPILVEGVTGEVDAKLESLLTDYISTVKPCAESLVTNMEKLKDKAEKADKAAKSKDKTADKENADEKSNSDEEDDKFSSGEADSL